MKKNSEINLFHGQWLEVCEVVYENLTGDRITWELVKRKKSVSGVVIVARMNPSKRFILIKQFRPAVGGYILSFPAGLGFGDPQHALVELKEETGYTCKITEVSPLLKTGSSLIDDQAHIVSIEVDERDPVNQNPVQTLEPAEDITVHLLEGKKIKPFLLEEQKKGIYVSSNLWYVFGLRKILKS